VPALDGEEECSTQSNAASRLTSSIEDSADTKPSAFARHEDDPRRALAEQRLDVLVLLTPPGVWVHRTGV